MLRRFVLKVAGLLVCCLALSPAAINPVVAATIKASTLLAVSATVVGGCTLSLPVSSPGGMHVDCPAQVRFSVRTVSSGESSASPPHQVVEVQY